MAKYGKKEGDNQIRLKTIIDAAEKVIIKKGYEEASFTDIAIEANYNKRNLYNYFENKDDLFAAVTFRVLDKIEKKIKRRIITNQNGLRNLIAIAWVYYDFFLYHPKYLNFLWILGNKFFVLNNKEQYSPYVKLSFDKRMSIVKLIYQVFEKGIADGSIKATNNPRVILTLFWAQTLGLLQVISRGSRFLSDELEVSYHDLFKLHIEKIIESLSND